MSRYPIRHRLPLLLMIVTAISTAHAEQITGMLPDNTLGFVLVHDAETASGKLSKLMGHFEVPLPAPLALLKFSTGLGDGLDTSRDALVAMLADKPESRSAQPIVLLPIRDYGAFAASIHADASGEVCRVTILGEDVLVAKKGSYAFLMNVEHRKSLERLLVRAPNPPESAAVLKAWLWRNDLAMVLLSEGMDRLLDSGRQGLGNSEQQLMETNRDSSTGKLVEQIRRSFELYRAIFESTGKQIETAAVGFALDNHGNVRVGVRLILDPDGDLAQVRMTGPSLLRPPAGVAEDPFVAAAGGPLPSGSSELLTRVIRRAFEEYSDTYGFEDFDDDDWHALEEATRGILEEVEALSVHMLPGRDEEPLVGNVHGILKVADAGRAMESFQESLETRNRLVSKSTSDIQYVYKVHPVTIEGVEGLDMVADVAAAARDPNVPMFEQVLEAMLGEAGTMHITMLPLDERTILVAIATRQRLARIVKQMREDRAGNATGAVVSANVQTTLELLPNEAPWFLLASPRGYLDWLSRWMERVMGPMGMAHQIPEFPQSPPIGCSLYLADGQLELELVLPENTLQGIAEYVEQLED